MSRKIYEFKLHNMHGCQDVLMPIGSNVLAAYVSYGSVFARIEVEDDKPKVLHSVILIFESENVPDGWEYSTTVYDNNVPMAHLYFMKMNNDDFESPLV